MKKVKNDKEFLYVGHYYDILGRYLLKIGTTNDLKRRRAEHTRNYRRAKNYQMPADAEFEYDWYLPLSKYNTLRFEDKNRQKWQEMGIGEFVRNDRFLCEKKPDFVEVAIRRTYQIALAWGRFFLAILPIDKRKKVWYNGPAAHWRYGRNFVSIGKFNNFWAKCLCVLPIDFIPKM